MLCPKCGYITFDKLLACPKCQKDWSEVVERINGTTTEIETACFLGRVIGEEEVVEASPEPVEPFVEENNNREDIVPVQESEDDFDVALDELPEIDLSGIEIEEPQPPVAETAAIEETNKQEPETSAGKDSKESDISVEEPAEKLEVGTGGLDLNEIDLSDLVTEEEEASDSPPGEELDLDLSSFELVGDKKEEGGFDLDFSDDDEDLNLSLDLEPDSAPQKKKKEDAEIPDLGLSLDD